MYCPSCSAPTVVSDQIANKSLVQLNDSVLGEYREKSSLRSASQARHQDSVTGEHKQIWGAQKVYEVTWRTERAPRPSTSRTQRARGTRSSRTEPIRIHR